MARKNQQTCIKSFACFSFIQGFLDVYIPCFQQTCPVDDVLRHWGSWHVMFVVIMFLLILCTWGACNWHILNLQDHILTESRGMAYSHVQQSPGLMSP